MIETSMLAYIPADDDKAWLDWLKIHADWHRENYLKAVKNGKPPYQVYTISEAPDLDEWAEFHNREHINTAKSLGLTEPPDLSDLDREDKENWDDWHKLHSLVHSDIRTLLGLT